MATQISTATLANLKKRVLERADMQNSYFVDDTAGDSELVRYIQLSYRKLYNKILSAFSDWYAEDPVEFTISSGNTYTVDQDFYKLLGVDFKLNGLWVEIRPFNFSQRNIPFTIDRNGYHPNIRYRLMGSKLRFIPTDEATGTYRYWYIAKPNIPTELTDTIDGENGWDEYVVCDAAAKCLAKEESDASYLLAERDQWLEDIMIHASNRDEGGTETVEDVTSDFEEY